MTKQELLDFLKFNSNKPRYYTVHLNKKVLEQFAIGYYQDLSANRFIVYEVTERQQLYEKASFEREEDAIEELYEIVKFRCRIKSIPIQLDVSEIDAIGTSDKRGICLVSHCYRGQDQVIRIISARKATKTERNIYEEGI